MESLKTLLLGLALIALTFVACQKDATIDEFDNELQRTSHNDQPEAPWVEKISGSGHYMVEFAPGEFDQRTFTVSAQKDADGNVSGQWTRVRRFDGNAAGTHSHGVVECFVIDGDYAWVGGHATSGAFSTPDTSDVGFRFYDGGNPGAGNDSLSLERVGALDGFAEQYCSFQPNFPSLRPLEQGNLKIEVR